MVYSFFWTLRRISLKIWVRGALVAVMSLFAVLIAPLVSPALPDSLTEPIDETAVRRLLDILTSSMLAVTTFSLSIMVTAHLAADQAVTPRSHRLLQQDTRTQTVLATFVGSFIYALVLTVILQLDVLVYDDLAVVYLVTIAVILFVVVAIMRWIAHLAGLGSLEATTRRVDEEAQTMIDRHRRAPLLGGEALPDRAAIPAAIPDRAREVHAPRHGYVQQIATSSLSAAMQEWGGRLYLRVRPGDWTNAGDVLAQANLAQWDLEREQRLAAAVTIGDWRTFEQDTGFPLIVLTEIAERALSTGVNDPRTAIDVIARLLRLTARLETVAAAEVETPRVHVPPLDTGALLDETFDRITRDGRGFVEVLAAAQAAYAALVRHRDPAVVAAAERLSARAVAYAEDGLLLGEDRARIAALALAGRPAAPADVAPDRSADGA